MQKQLITILGPTACGKTEVATHVAALIGGEILSGDSRQVYRRMDIGTGKDLGDYIVDGKAIPYHLIDIAQPGTKYNLFQYQHDFYRAYQDIMERGAWPILCGGTGLYIEAVLRGYALSPVPQNDELRERLEGKSLKELTAMLMALKQQSGSAMHNTTDVDSPRRAIRAIEIETYNLKHAATRRTLPPTPSLVIGIDMPREERRRRITARLKQRLDGGMIDEVRSLLESGIPADNLIYYGLEYRYVTLYVLGQLSYNEMFRQLEIAIHQFAKRQMTWFRGMERRGTPIHWIDGTMTLQHKVDTILQIIRDRLAGSESVRNKK